jgi:pilus assembly protein CpaB
MRRGRTLFFVLIIILIIVLGGGAFLYTQYQSAQQAATPVQQASVEVYIAGQNIPAGATITPDLLATIKIAPENVVEVMYTIEEQPALVGRVAKFPLDQGVVITSAMVGDASSSVAIAGPSWAALIPSGMTAVSIPSDRFSLSAFSINNGAHVNINACFLFVDIDPTFQSALPNKTAALTGTGFTTEGAPAVVTLGVGAAGTEQGRLELDPSLQQPYYLLPSEAQRPRMVCQTIMQDVVVMKVGDFSLAEGATLATPSTAPTTDANGNPVPATPSTDIVTLIVTPQDAITLTYLLNINQVDPNDATKNVSQTRLSMTLRNPSDQARQATEAATLQFLLSQYNIPIPAKLPYALQPALTSLNKP